MFESKINADARHSRFAETLSHPSSVPNRVQHALRVRIHCAPRGGSRPRGSSARCSISRARASI